MSGHIAAGEPCVTIEIGHHTEAKLATITRLILGVAMLIGVAIAPYHADAAAQGKRVAVFMGPTQDKYLGTLSGSFKKTAEGLGMKVTIYSSPFDPALQAQQIDDAIAQKFDLFVVQIISQKAIIPVLNRVKVAKIPVLLIVVPLVGEGQSLFVSYVGSDHAKVAELAAESLVKALNEGQRKNAKVAIISGSLAEGVAPIRLAEIKKVLAKAPGTKIVAVEDVHWNPALGERAAGQVLARFAGQGGLDAMYGMNDALGNAIVQAADSAGLKFGTGKDGLIVIGGNCMAPGVRDLKAGKMFATVLVDPALEGRMAAAEAKDILEGKTVPKYKYSPHVTITKANLASYEKRCSY